MLWDNAGAIRSFNQAIRISRQHRFTEIEIKAAVGRISIYKRIPDYSAALQAVREMEPLLAGSRDPATLVQIASVTRDIDFDTTLGLYRRAVLEGSASSDLHVLSMLWGQLGHLWLLRGDAVRAEPALTEAFRLRCMAGRREMQGFYFYLGWLRRLQGRYEDAALMLGEARRRSGEPGSLHAWVIDRELARTQAAAGDLPAALESYESAARLAEESRAFTVPAEAFRVASEEGLHGMFTEYVETGMQLYARKPDRSLAARLLSAADRSRRFLFRAALAQQTSFPPVWLAKVTEYRRALAASLGATARRDAGSLEQLRLELANLEIELGILADSSSPQFLEKDLSANALKGIQKNLRTSELLLSFLVAGSGSYIWAVTHDSFEVHRLPGAVALAGSVTRFREALQAGKPDAGAQGRMLVDDLLKPVSTEALSRRDWIASLDAPLFDLPFAALPDPSGQGLLCDRHSIRLAPTAFAAPARRSVRSRIFSGIADPVYNRADERATFPQAASAGPELTRLPGSARELKRCAGAWSLDAAPSLITGRNACRRALRQELRRGPAVLHLGVHVVQHPAAPEEVMLALGTSSGEPEYLTPAEISTWRHPLGLVTLSGCSSGAGRFRPGLGLFGLTRAWLAAGAASVVASYWPIRDDDGQLLATMYSELSKHGGSTRSRDVARALQEAQNRSKRRNDWQAQPSYWAAFFVVGKE